MQRRTEFEEGVSSLFSDLWLGMTDEIYFDQSYEYTRERLSKSGVDPEALFGDKVVVDAGCGGGKFSSAIARMAPPRSSASTWDGRASASPCGKPEGVPMATV